MFEGADGVGKTTQVHLLAAWLEANGHRVVLVREPGGTPAGERIRDLLLDPALALDPLAETLLFAAARTELVRRVIEPALAEGAVVLADRFTWSTVAYQHYGAGVPRYQVETLNDWATRGLAPDLTVLLTAPTPRRLNRDRMEQQGSQFHERVRAGYLELAREPSPDMDTIRGGARAVIDQVGDPEHVAAAVLDAVRPLLDREGGQRA